MTVPTSTAKSGPYAGSGTTGPFTVGFRFLENSHLQVIRTSSTGVDTTLTLSTDYTVSGAGGSSGTVTLVTALAVGQKLTIIRNVPFTQDADYVQNDAFPAESHERALDKLTMQTQQLLEAVDRAAKLPVTSTADSEELVADITLLADNITLLTAVYGALPAITVVGDDLEEPTSEIETVAGAIANVNTVGNNISNVNTVAGISSNVTSVAGNATNINAVAGNASNITAVAGNATNINAVNANKTNIDAVAGNATNINAVGANSTNINAVNANAANINTVAGASSNVNTVATNITSVNSAATNMAAIIAAPGEAAAAAASAAAAAASAASGMYSAVQDKSADYTVVLGDAGDLIRMTTSGGARTVTLPLISSLPDGFNVTVVKWSGDGNACTVQRSGSDVINGSTSYALDALYKSATFVADLQSNTWFASGSGAASSNISVDAFSGNGSTVAFTLSGDPGTENNTQVFVGGVYQEKDTYSVSGTTLTFSAAPPSGTSNIEVVWAQPLAIGVPGDGTVSTAKIADGAVTTAKIADLAVTSGKIADGAVATADIADSAVTTAKIANANVTIAKLSATGTPDSTTFLRGDGSWQTAGGTPTTAQVLTATAGASAGDVGTYGLMYQTNINRYTQGNTIAGSSLRFCDVSGSNSAGGSAASGTWRCMGTTDPFYTGNYTTLWLRIS